jgi:hypothetical protein
MFSPRPLEPRGRWIALTAATVVYQFAYWPMIMSVIGGEGATSAGLWLGLAITPLVFMVLAFTSRHPRAPGATGRAMGLFLLIGLPIGLVNIVIGLAAGFGAGAIAALRREPEVHPLKPRIIAVIAGSVYLFVLSLFGQVYPGVAQFVLVSGAVIGLAVVGLADEVSEARADGVDRHEDL